MHLQMAELKKQTMTLEPQDKLELITYLWDSIASDAQLSEDEETIRIAKQRDYELEHGLVEGVGHEEVMASLKAIADEARLSPRGN